MNIVVGYCGPGHRRSGDTGHLLHFEDHIFVKTFELNLEDRRKDDERTRNHVTGGMIEKLGMFLLEKRRIRGTVASSLFKYSKEHHMEEG